MNPPLLLLHNTIYGLQVFCLKVNFHKRPRNIWSFKVWKISIYSKETILGSANAHNELEFVSSIIPRVLSRYGISVRALVSTVTHCQGVTNTSHFHLHLPQKLRMQPSSPDLNSTLVDRYRRASEKVKVICHMFRTARLRSPFCAGDLTEGPFT